MTQMFQMNFKKVSTRQKSNDISLFSTNKNQAKDSSYLYTPTQYLISKFLTTKKSIQDDLINSLKGITQMRSRKQLDGKELGEQLSNKRKQLEGIKRKLNKSCEQQGAIYDVMRKRINTHQRNEIKRMEKDKKGEDKPQGKNLGDKDNTQWKKFGEIEKGQQGISQHIQKIKQENGGYKEMGDDEEIEIVEQRGNEMMRKGQWNEMMRKGQRNEMMRKGQRNEMMGKGQLNELMEKGQKNEMGKSWEDIKLDKEICFFMLGEGVRMEQRVRERQAQRMEKEKREIEKRKEEEKKRQDQKRRQDERMREEQNQMRQKCSQQIMEKEQQYKTEKIQEKTIQQKYKESTYYKDLSNESQKPALQQNDMEMREYLQLSEPLVFQSDRLPQLSLSTLLPLQFNNLPAQQSNLPIISLSQSNPLQQHNLMDQFYNLQRFFQIQDIELQSIEVLKNNIEKSKLKPQPIIPQQLGFHQKQIFNQYQFASALSKDQPYKMDLQFSQSNPIQNENHLPHHIFNHQSLDSFLSNQTRNIFHEEIQLQCMLYRKQKTISFDILSNQLSSINQFLYENSHMIKKYESNIQFWVTLCKAIQLIKSKSLQNQMEGIQIIRIKLNKMKGELQDWHKKQLEKVSSMLLYEEKMIQIQPYLQKTQQSFRQVFQQIYKLPDFGKFLHHIYTGALILKTPTCIQKQKQNPLICPLCSPLAENVFKSIPLLTKNQSNLICRINGSVMDHQNYPIMLPSNQIYSLKGLQQTKKTIKTNTGKLIQQYYCKFTNTWYSKDQAKKVFLA